VDFGHFYRFKASVGLALVVASVGLPWLVFRDDSALSVSRSDLAALTARAQRVIEQKQQHYELLLNALPVISGALFLLGIILLIQGIRGWKIIQGVLDRRELADTVYKENQITPLSPAERHGDDVRKAEDDLPSQIEVEAPVPAVPAETDDKAGMALDTDSRSVQVSQRREASDSLRASMDRRRRVEEIASQRLSVAFRRTHQVERDIAIRSDQGVRATVDLLLRPKDILGDAIVVDVYSIIDERSFYKNASHRFSQLALFGDLYRLSENQQVRCVLLLVFDFKRSLQVGSDLTTLDRLRRRLVGYQEVYPNVVAIATDERALRRVSPADLRRAIEEGRSTFLDPFGGQLVLPLDWSQSATRS
jgi:hypothetical protein